MTLEEVLDNFDFHTVRRIMKLMNWKWWNSIEGDSPTVQQMRGCVKSLYEDTLTEVEYTKKDCVLFSGGFEVKVYADKNFDIKFVPVESTSYIVGV